MADSFRGWTEDFQRFFIGLELENSKRYFDANRKLYLEKVKGPMERLLAELEPEFGPGSISRPNRDTRFSADKSPYKRNIYASASRGGYVALDARGLTAAAGRYHLEKPEIDAFRVAVAANGPGKELAGIVARLQAEGYEIGGADLKRVPAGFPADHPRAGLLKHKRLFFWRAFGLHPWLGTARAADHIARVWSDGRPLEDWFSRNLKVAGRPGA